MSYLPEYNASPEKNSEYIRQILPLMMKYDVPVDPMNYAIWYHYVAGTNIELNNAINSLILEKKIFDYNTNINLYKMYVCTVSVESIEKANKNLNKLIEKTAVSLNTTRDVVSSTGDSFNVKLSELNTPGNDLNIKLILSEIISETTQLAEASKVLKNQLDNSNKELDNLRNELNNVRKASNTDGLTGLLNRLAFDKILDELIDNFNTTHVCLAILDIDHFKNVNDNFGHLVGDKVIKYFSSLLKKHAKTHYHVARYGGEELAVIMPDTTLIDAFNLIEEIRGILDKTRLKHKGDTETIGKVTVSAGIALMREMDTAYTFIDRADKALYMAKQTGRNKVLTEKSLSF